MICPNPNGIDIREMPQRFEEAFHTMLDIRKTLAFFMLHKEIPLCHEDGRPLDVRERADLTRRLSSVSDEGSALEAICYPVRDFVSALRQAMTAETTAGAQRTTGGEDPRLDPSRPTCV